MGSGSRDLGHRCQRARAWGRRSHRRGWQPLSDGRRGQSGLDHRRLGAQVRRRPRAEPLMTSAFLAAVVDTILPGEAGASGRDALAARHAGGLAPRSGDRRACGRSSADRGARAAAKRASSPPRRRDAPPSSPRSRRRASMPSAPSSPPSCRIITRRPPSSPPWAGAQAGRSRSAMRCRRPMTRRSALLEKVRARGPIWRDPGERQA